MKKLIKAGAVDQTIDIFIQNSSSTTGAGLTGLAYNTASLVCYYRKGATGSATALTLATQTVGGAHSDGGFVEIDATNMPGMYRLDLSDTIVATAGSVTLMLKGATNMAPLPIELQVVSFNPEDAVRLGLTALPNAAAEAAGGLYTRGSGAGQINQPANGRIDVDLKAILATVLTETSAGYLAAAFKNLFDVAVPVLTAASVNQTGDNYARLGAPAGASVSADVAAVLAAVLVVDDYVDTEIAAMPASVWAYTVEGSYTAVQYLRLITSALAAKLSGAATTTVTIRDIGDTKARITATVDADGNRSAVTLDGT